MPFIDLTGQRFGKLTVMERAPRRGMDRAARWVCRCDCSNEIMTRGGDLRYGHVASCGCYGRSTNRKHGMTDTPEWRSWKGMVDRCGNHHPHWRRYAGRGITICDRWRFGENRKTGFECFFEDMGQRPPGLMLERIDNNGGYEPSNCEWATLRQQANNRWNSKHLVFNGRNQTQAEWAREVGMTRSLLAVRLRRGWPLERALLTSVGGASCTPRTSLNVPVLAT